MKSGEHWRASDPLPGAGSHVPPQHLGRVCLFKQSTFKWPRLWGTIPEGGVTLSWAKGKDAPLFLFGSFPQSPPISQRFPPQKSWGARGWCCHSCYMTTVQAGRPRALGGLGAPVVA